jgi:hypothetical protein
MRKISLGQFLRIRETTANAFNVQRFRGEVALAFGRERRDIRGEYLDLDLITMETVDRLMRFFPNRKDAATLVRTFWPQLFVILSRAEEAQKEDYIFFVGGREADPGVKNWMVHGGHFNEVTHSVFSLPADRRPTHFFYVDIWEAVQAVRARAKAEGVQLDERFFYSLDDPRCEARIIEELREHQARLTRECMAGSPHSVKVEAPVLGTVMALIVEARGAMLQ